MVVFFSITGTLLILYGLRRSFFSVLGADMDQVIASVVFIVLGIACIGASFLY